MSDDREKLNPESKPQWVKEWKEIKSLSRVNRSQACEKIENLSWASEFPFPNIISDKKSIYCRKPPAVVVNDFYSLMKAAQFYRNDFKNEKAQEYLSRAKKKAKTKLQKISFWDEQLKLDRAQQDKEKRLRSARKLKELDPDRYLADYARMLWTYDKTSEAQKILHSAPSLFRKSTSLQEVYFILGRIQEEKGKPQAALLLYDKALQQPLHSNEVITKILAFAAWVNYKLQAFDLSTQFWQQLYEKSSERFTKSRALFWKAQSEKKRKNESEYQNLLNRLIQEDPTSYYTILAHRELKKPFQPLKPLAMDGNPLKKLKFYDDSEKQLLSWLEAFDEKEMAEIILLYGWDQNLKANESVQQAYFSYYWKLGLTNALTRMLNLMDDTTRLKLTEAFQAALFPYHYENEIKKAAAEEKIDPYFVMSLIRQESAFNPEARSPTDAVGLMQVMPSLAKRIARDNPKDKKLQFAETSELFDPQLNLKFGTMELNERLADFKGSQILAAASYNAGVDVTRSWLQTRFRPDPIEFIEEIPYEETRSYVRLILRNEIFYQRLFSREPFLFPEEALTKGWPDSVTSSRKTKKKKK